MCYPRYIEYALRRRALNTDVTAKLWPHKYLFNAEWNLVQGSHSNYKIFFQKLQYSSENETVQLAKIRKY